MRGDYSSELTFAADASAANAAAACSAHPATPEAITGMLTASVIARVIFRSYAVVDHADQGTVVLHERLSWQRKPAIVDDRLPSQSTGVSRPRKTA